MEARKVFYIVDRKLVEATLKVPNVKNRCAVVNNLIAAYGLLSKCLVCPSEVATLEDLRSFHSADYIKCLQRVQATNDLEVSGNSSFVEEHNLGYDCPLFDNIYEFVRTIAGGTLTAAKHLVTWKHVDELGVNCVRSVTSTSGPKSYLKLKVNKQKLQAPVTEDVFDIPDEETLDCLHEDRKLKHCPSVLKTPTIPKDVFDIPGEETLDCDNKDKKVRHCPSVLKTPTIPKDVFDIPGEETLDCDNKDKKVRHCPSVLNTPVDVFDIPDEETIDGVHKDKKVKHSPSMLNTKHIKSHDKEENDNASNVPVAINWQGGWHHAQRDEAEGFCYVNDIVIAIQYLLQVYSRVLYIDLDIHHGNGVENAFSCCSRVLTLSIHKHEPGFYPTTGSVTEQGISSGKYYTVNIPLRDGVTDHTYCYVFTSVLQRVVQRFDAECVVVQCGADGLTGDPLGGFNLTTKGLGECLKLILELKRPTLIVGGGGYNIPNVARLWAYLTSIVVNTTISNDIPDNHYFPLFGPDFDLHTSPSLRKDSNTKEYITELLKKIFKNIEQIR